MPERSLESNITFTLYNLKLISSPEAYSKAEKGLENYAAGAGYLAVVSPEEEDVIRHRVLVVINETRRQTLSLSQLEILRDGVTRELLVASARLIIPLALILIGIGAITIPREIEFQFATGIVLVCIGGVVGSFLSAIVRVGRMLDNQHTGRTVILLAGESRCCIRMGKGDGGSGFEGGGRLGLGQGAVFGTGCMNSSAIALTPLVEGVFISV